MEDECFACNRSGAYAAETGRFPESLDQIQVVPVPKNPITTHPYLYRLEGKMAILELPFSDGMPGVASRYEIQLAEPSTK